MRHQNRQAKRFHASDVVPALDREALAAQTVGIHARRKPMADISNFEDVPLPAEKVWSVIGDFSGIRKWAVLVEAETTADTQAGKVRTLNMPEGRVVKELLAMQSQYSYTYTMVDRPDMPGYRSTVAAVPLDANTTRITLIVHMNTTEANEEEVVNRYTRSLRGNLRAMKKALGLA
jgi:hypothetical protein